MRRQNMFLLSGSYFGFIQDAMNSLPELVSNGFERRTGIPSNKTKLVESAFYACDTKGTDKFIVYRCDLQLNGFLGVDISVYERLVHSRCFYGILFAYRHDPTASAYHQ